MRITRSTALLALALSASAAHASSAKPATIKFALVGPLTGDRAVLGVQARRGAALAVEEVNAAGGVNGKKLEMVLFDDQGDPQKAELLAAKIAENSSLLFVLGHVNSRCSLAALPNYEKRVPVISPANSAPKLTTLGFPNYFRVNPDASVVGERIVLVGTTELRLTRPALVWENTDYGKSLRDPIAAALTAKGIALLKDEAYAPGPDHDFSGLITKLKKAGADSVYFVGEAPATAHFLKQARALGFTAQLLGAGGNSDPNLLKLAGPTANGAVVTALFDPYDRRPRQASFVKRFTERARAAPGEFAAQAYDIVYLVKAALEAGATDRASLIERLHSLKAFEGVTGRIEFNDRGEVPGKKAFVLKVQDGKFVQFTPKKR